MPRSEPQPDAYRAGHPTAKDVFLLIEIGGSTLRYDFEVKARLYAKHGVPETF